ncbi:hypothetical protein KIW84_012462 [Lathyrus oleraceus]|uniref:Uncharacterized protein n=1 Tax=Pisum sativum TaxID=3888 RepID=A0A9D5GWD3_PEA|nr:hypothetical protein KIW84_012462 [Pisum sativum]
MFTWSTYKIYMAHILHFDKNPREKKSNFLVMTQSKKELEVVKETEFFCPVVIKGLMSTLNEETTISEETTRIKGIPEDFKELNADELPNNLYPMRDKGVKVKIFNVGDDMMVFLLLQQLSGHRNVYTMGSRETCPIASFFTTLRTMLVLTSITPYIWCFHQLTMAKNTRMKGLEVVVNGINTTMQKMMEDADARHNNYMQHRHTNMVHLERVKTQLGSLQLSSSLNGSGNSKGTP